MRYMVLEILISNAKIFNGGFKNGITNKYKQKNLREVLMMLYLFAIAG